MESSIKKKFSKNILKISKHNRNQLRKNFKCKAISFKNPINSHFYLLKQLKY